MSTPPTTPPDELAPRRGAKRGAKKGRRPGGPSGPITGGKAINLTEKQAKALQLRQAGATLKQVAVELGFNEPSQAHALVMSALKTILPDETRDEYRRLELARLDRLQMGHWTAAINGDDKAAVVVLRCMAARAKLLGLEAPAQVQVNLYEGEMVEVEVLKMLDAKQLEELRSVRSAVAELSRMRAGAVDAEPS